MAAAGKKTGSPFRQGRNLRSATLRVNKVPALQTEFSTELIILSYKEKSGKTSWKRVAGVFLHPEADVGA